jgi:hypothetical protein
VASKFAARERDGFGIAATLVAGALSGSLATPDRPVVSAKWVPVGGRWLLSGIVKASGLKTDDQLAVGVFRLVDNGEPPPPSPKPTTVYTAPATPWWSPPEHYVYTKSLVYEQTVGADIDGNATVNFEVPLPDGYGGLQVVATLGTRYDCALRQSSAPTIPTPKFACLTLDAPDTTPKGAASPSG